MKTVFKLIFAVLIISIFSVSNGYSKGKPKIPKDKKIEFNKKSRPLVEITGGNIKFVLRWAGMAGWSCPCPKCKCSGCPCALGMCACGNLVEISENMDMGDDVGTAFVWFDSNYKLHVKFNQLTAVNIPSISANDVVPVSGNANFTTAICQILGYNSIIIPNGFYQVDYTNSTYGTIIVDATTN